METGRPSLESGTNRGRRSHGGSGERLWSALDAGGLAILNVLPTSCSQVRTRVLKDDLAGLGRVAQRDAPRFVEASSTRPAGLGLLLAAVGGLTARPVGYEARFE